MRKETAGRKQGAVQAESREKSEMFKYKASDSLDNFFG